MYFPFIDDDLTFCSSPLLENPILALRVAQERRFSLREEHDLPLFLDRFQDRLVNGEHQ